MSEQGWIGVDLDGTLAHYDEWRGVEHIGEPIAPMVKRVQGWLNEGKEVRVFTARVYPLTLEDSDPATNLLTAGTIQEWCRKHIGRVLPITCVKDFGMVELWDDRAVQVIPNTGKALQEHPRLVSSEQ